MLIRFRVLDQAEGGVVDDLLNVGHLLNKISQMGSAVVAQLAEWLLPSLPRGTRFEAVIGKILCRPFAFC